MAKLLLGWSVVLVGIVFGARAIWQEKVVVPKNATVGKVESRGPTEEEIATLNEAGPSCNRCFSGFLAAGTPEERNQFVADPIGTASRMARFYGLNPMVNIDPSHLVPQTSAVLHLPKGDAVETLWKTPEGKELDAVFVKDGGEWRLDWEHFVRYSDYPWALFLAGSGDPQGEFRLLARERLADERKNESSISLVLYAPRFGSSTETGFQSPEFLIKRDSENGRLLEAAFSLAKAGGRAFNVKLRDSNPEGLIRLRAKVKRIDSEMQRRFELEKVIACHWYSVDEPGVTPLAQPLEK